MKKLSIMMAALVAMMGLASCDQKDEPKLTIPEPGSFVLNTPVMASEYMQLAPGGAFELVTSQPDYGFAAAAQYGAQVSLTENFATYETLKPTDAAKARMVFDDNDLAVALCNLHGFTPTEYTDLPAEKVYFRATVEIPGVEGTAMISNVVAMNQVKFYHAVAGKAKMYVVGNFTSNWAEPTAEAQATYDEKGWYLEETEIGSGVFTGMFEVAVEDVAFRLYGTMKGWNSGSSVGSAEEPTEGDNYDVTLTGGKFTGATKACQTNWRVKGWTAGSPIKITYEQADNKITIEEGAAGEKDYSKYKKVFVVGAAAGGWNVDKATPEQYMENGYCLYDFSGTGIYTNDKPMKMTADYFRIYTELGDYGADGALPSIGPLPDDETHVDIEAYPFTGIAVPGKGSWVMSAGGEYKLVLNMVDPANMTFSIEAWPAE